MLEKTNVFFAKSSDEIKLKHLRLMQRHFQSEDRSKEELLERKNIKKEMEDIGFAIGFHGINIRHYRRYENILSDEIRKLEIKLKLIKSEKGE